MFNEFKELFQAFILPQFEGLKGDIRALDSKISSLDTKIAAVDTKIESFRRELLSEIHRAGQVLSRDFVRLEQKIDLRLAALDK